MTSFADRTERAKHIERPASDPSADGTCPIGPSPAPSPAERLAASREALRAALMHRHTRAARRKQAKAHADEDTPSPKFSERVRDLFDQVPLSGVATRWLTRWWQRNPWRPTIEFALESADEVTRPMAEKNPWLLLGGAFAVGALVSRPKLWRMLSSGALMAGLVPRLQVPTILNWASSMLREQMGGGTPAPQGPVPSQAQQQTTSAPERTFGEDEPLTTAGDTPVTGPSVPAADHAPTPAARPTVSSSTA